MKRDFPMAPSEIAADTGVRERTPIHRRLFSSRALSLLFRNTVVSCIAFGLGLILLWLLVEKAGANKYLAAALSFLFTNTTHYIFGRLWIFEDSQRGLGSGYLLFFVTAGFGMGATLLLFAALTDVLGMNYLVARIVASLFAGLAMFASNALLNFKSL